MTDCIILDDDPFWTEEIANALRGAGITPHRTTTVKDALAVLRRHPEAAMVIDVILPERDGLEAIRDVRQSSDRTPIVAISGGGRIGPDFYLRLARTLGADDSLAKPFTPKALLARLDALGHRAPSRAI